MYVEFLQGVPQWLLRRNLPIEMGEVFCLYSPYSSPYFPFR